MANLARVYLGHLSSRAREDDVERFFKGYGRIKEIHLKNGYGFVEFDDVRDAEDAVHDLNDKDLCGERVRIEHARYPPRYERGPPRGGGSDYYRGDRGGGYGNRGGGGGYDRGGAGGRDRPNYFNSRAFDKYGPPRRTDYRLIVENLSTRVSWQDLKDYLRQAGEVTYAEAHKEKRNIGMVDCQSYTDMKNILEKLDDTEINGRRIQIRKDTSRRQSRSRSRSRSRGRRSRSPSRSRSRSRSGRRSRHSRRRSRSRSDSRSQSRDSKSRSRSRSRSKSRSKSKSRSRSQSADKEKRKRSKSRSRSKSHSRSPTPIKDEVNGD